MQKPMDILVEFPVRKSKQQKLLFLDAVKSYAAELNYPVSEEKGSLGVRNLVIGDPVSSDYLITAHYDTCARMPFPNLITPCNAWAFIGWQLVLLVILCVPAGIVAGLVSALLHTSDFLGIFCYLLVLGELLWLMVGPANRSNANDNTSGVVTLLETAAACPLELRNKVCFVLFDLEEAGLLGSAEYRKKHRKESSRQIVLNLDCVGEGNEILLFPTKKMKKRTKDMDIFRECCSSDDSKSISVIERGFSVYPSDQANFPLGFGIAALCRSKWAGLYLGKIHTNRDTVLDENNVAMLRDYLIKIIRTRA